MTTSEKTISNSSGTSRATIRQIEILTICKAKPQTIQHLADHFNVGYYTIRNDIVFLEKIGQIKKTTYGSGTKAVLWETTTTFKTKGLRFHTEKASLPIDSLVSTFSTSHKNTIRTRFKAVAGTICALYQTTKRRSEGFEGAGVSPVELRRILRHSHNAIKQMLLLVEQLLAAPIWEENDDALTLLKALEEYPQTVALSNWLEREYVNYYSPLFDDEDSAQKKS